MSHTRNEAGTIPAKRRAVVAALAAAVVCMGSLAAATGTADAAAKKFTGVSAPTISDTTPVVGQKLTAKPDKKTTPTATSKTYQWYRGSAKIKGATKSAYTVTSSDKGKTIKVKVCYKKSTYTTKCVTSKATKKAATPKRASSGTQRGVTPGAFCSPVGASGTTKKGTPMRCTTKAGDSRARWRSA